MLRYACVARASFRTRAYYRFELVFEALKAGAMALVLVLVWRALYASAPEIGDFTLEQMLAYTGAATLLALVFNIEVAHDLSDRLKSGSIASDLIRPLPLAGYLFSIHLGRAAYALLFAGIPFALALVASGGIDPHGLLAAAPFAALAFLLYYAICQLLALGVFFTEEAWGIEYLRMNLVRFFAGGIVPLSLLPEPLAAVSAALPFELVFYVPAAIAAGKLTASWPLATRGLVWLAVLIAIAAAGCRLAMRRVTVHGG